ncbi:TetR/AcrR family transcriptional regulator [Streptomyces sp. V2]|jgi:AcrR family transcriptional regulator|uniref:TetR/AcrR family transcriptional regulator n=1 Tax=Streptomyces TaxID=1883 RepID=UPI0006EB2DE5|nr:MULTISPECIES: TetR/AcrR family transcriptional regulator [Streptomyces]PWG12739.1 TetR/AcrR family transcriptional regulator [Streptomyces sp. V2]QZZ31448.1 helix-turn-helix transcriptional regulator [Streptomyces sp. ST1015]
MHEATPSDPNRPHAELSARLRVPKIGRPPQIGHDAIVAAAVAVGFEELSMSAVARHLGVKHSTLYRYFPHKGALLAAAADHVVAAMDWPAPCPSWRPYLRALARTTFRMFEAHPGLALHVAALRGGLVEYARQGARTAAVLVDTGLDPEFAVLAQDLVNEQVLLFFLAGQQEGQPATNTEETAQLRRVMLDDVRDAVPGPVADAFERVVGGRPEDWLNRKIEVILDGIAATVPAAGKNPRE